jgi:hypothetical protein
MTAAWNANTLKIQMNLLLNYFQELEGVLSSDQVSFAANDTQQVELNNARKTTLLEKISEITQLVSNSQTSQPTQSFMQQVELALSQMDQASQHEISKVLIEIKATMAECEKRIATNSNIVYSTLNHIKNIWDDLLTSKPGMECVYDSKGQTKK